MRGMSTVRWKTRQFFPGDVAAVFDWVQTPANWRHLDNVAAVAGSGKLGDVVSITWLQEDTQVESVIEVIEYDRPRRVLNRSRSEPVTVEELTFRAHDGGTVVTSNVTTHYTQTLGVLGWVATRRKATEMTRRQLEQLAAAFTERTTPAVGAQPAEDPTGPYLQDE